MELSNTNDLPENCPVCGDENTRINYGVRCCDSCKIFFRRNIHFDLKTNQCKSDGNCLITKLTRHQCRYCRLKKCLIIGMNKDLLRSPHGIKLKQENFIYPLDLLQNNRSLLTNQQWSLLSNIINSFNNQSPIGYIRYLISNQLNYPPKLRLKKANDHLMDILHSIYIILQSLINFVPEFLQMNINHRNALIERNLRNVGGLNALFILHQVKIFDDFAYSNSLLSIYGSLIFNGAFKLSQQLENDGTLIKLLLIILAFSTSSDVVNFQSNQIQTTNTIDLFEIQNIYTEILFKYMCYRYGYNEAASRFASLMQTFLYQNILTASASDISIHESMIQTIINKTEPQ